MKRGLHPAKLRNIREYKEQRWKKGRSRSSDFELAKRQKEKFKKREDRAADLIRQRQQEEAEYRKKLKAELAGGMEPEDKKELQMISKDQLNALVKSQQRVLLDEMEESLRKEMKDVEKAGIKEKMRVFGNTLPHWAKSLLPIKHTTGVIEERFAKRKQKKIKDLVEVKKLDTKFEIRTKSTVDIMVERKEKLNERKIEIGCLASAVVADPQLNIRSLKLLGNFMKETDPDIEITVKKYAALTLLEIFNSILPSYRIEPEQLKKIQEANAAIRFKKVKKLVYQYEEVLLNEYKHYLIDLENILNEKKKNNSPAVKNLIKVVLHCYCDLLKRHSHFNFTNNIIQAITPYADHKDPQVAEEVLSTYSEMFKKDKNGALTLEIVTRMNKFIRNRHFKVKPHCMKPFIYINAADESNLDILIEAKMNAKKKLTHTEKLIRKVKEERSRKRSRREMKKSKKQRVLEEKMKDIENDRKDKFRHALHAKILQIVFGLYIHVLKRKPNSELNEVVLEGLCKFSHHINIEYFSDLLDVLGSMMMEGTMNFRESMYSIKTVFTILSGQGEALTLDPRRFYIYLYANMLNISKGQSAVLPALDALKMILVDRQKTVSRERCLAFSKRLCTICLSLPYHNSILSALSLQRSIMISNPSTSLLLEIDSEGTSGVFNPEVDEPEHSNASASAYYEYTLLNRHYHSQVQKMTNHLMHGAPAQGEGALPGSVIRKSIEEVYEMYDPTGMRFNPSVPHPGLYITKKLVTKMRVNKNKQARFITPYMNREMDSVHIHEYKDLLNGSNSSDDSAMDTEEPSDELDKADFFSSMIMNMNLANIPDKPEEEDEEGWNVDVSYKLLATQ